MTKIIGFIFKKSRFPLEISSWILQETLSLIKSPTRTKNSQKSQFQSTQWFSFIRKRFKIVQWMRIVDKHVACRTSSHVDFCLFSIIRLRWSRNASWSIKMICSSDEANPLDKLNESFVTFHSLLYAKNMLSILFSYSLKQVDISYIHLMIIEICSCKLKWMCHWMEINSSDFYRVVHRTWSRNDHSSFYCLMFLKLNQIIPRGNRISNFSLMVYS